LVQSKPKLILLITIDCLRADHLGCLGYDRNVSPYIDELAKGGVTFSQAISQSSATLGAFPAIFASRYGLNAYDGNGNLKDLPTIPKLLKEEGYVTAGFNSNPFLSRVYNWNQGFDYFYDNFESTRFIRNKKLYSLVGNINRLFNYALSNDPCLSADGINRKAFKWLESNYTQGSNVFLWLHYMDAHGPYVLPKSHQKPFLKKPLSNREIRKLCHKAGRVKKRENLSDYENNTLKNLYDAEICYVDEQLKSLMQELKKCELYEESLIIITSDHGEELCQHGRFRHGGAYDEVLRVPLLLLYPGEIPKGKMISRQIRLIDLAPTITDILDKKPPGTWEGESLLPLLKKQNVEYRPKEAYSWNSTPSSSVTYYSIRTEEYKYIITIRKDEGTREEAFDLLNDPLETKNLIEHSTKLHPSLQMIQAKLHNFMAKFDRDHIAQKSDLNREIEEKLRYLGYMD